MFVDGGNLRLLEVQSDGRRRRRGRAARRSRRGEAGLEIGGWGLIARNVAEECRDAGASFAELVIQEGDLAVEVVDFGDLPCDLASELVDLSSGRQGFASVVSWIPG